MKLKIAVLDYDIGNVKSVIKALEFVGARAVLTDNPEEILKSAGLVVPGVSAFGACIEKLRQKKLFELKLKHSTVKLKNPLEIRNLRRDIARIKTLLRQKFAVKL